MKCTATLSLNFALSASGLTIAQPSDMKEMKDMDHWQQSKSRKAMRHQATAVVKDVDAANGKVTLAHEPVKSLKWPAMTMGFAVKDKMLFDKLTVGKKVKVELMQQGSEYVVTAVK